jgi:hypothetical protein
MIGAQHEGARMLPSHCATATADMDLLLSLLRSRLLNFSANQTEEHRVEPFEWREASYLLKFESPT